MAKYKQNWVSTDPATNQFGRQLSEFLFEFKEDNMEQTVIDITAYTNAVIEDCINSYGYTIMGKDNEQNLHLFPRDEKNWLIAECLFEQDIQPLLTTYSIDIPQLNSQTGIPSDEWRCIAEFPNDRAAAIKFAMEHLGADENGMICVISEY